MSTQVTTNENTVNVTTSGQTVVVQAAGIQGPTGAAGPAGADADTTALATTGSNVFVGDQIITGSLTISGSSTLTNIGPAIFSGSITATAGITGSFSGTATSASFAVTASHALFAVSASHEITFEVSSSHAQSADQAGDLFGTPSIAVNHITSSGNISASGDIFANDITLDANGISDKPNVILKRGSVTGAELKMNDGGNDNGIFLVNDFSGLQSIRLEGGGKSFFSQSLNVGVPYAYPEPVGGTFTVRGTISSSGAFNTLSHITASGNISASGTVVGSNLSGTNTGDQNISNLAVTGSDVIFGHITASGNMSASGDISGVTGSFDHITGNPASATFFKFGTINEVAGIHAGNTIPSFGQLTFQTFNSNYSTNLNGITRFNNVLLGSGSGGGVLHIGNSLNSVSVDILGPITASGNISGSSTTIFSGNQYQALSGFRVLETTADVLRNSNDLPILSHDNSGTPIVTSLGSDDLGGTNLSQVQLITDIGEILTVSGSTVTVGPNAATHGTEALNVRGNVSSSGFGLFEAGKPITTHTTHFSASIFNAGHYLIVGGNLTCSISASTAPIGAEYEFFQTSSAGNMLFQTGSGVTLISKNNSLRLAQQGSSAVLKKVGTGTFHLMGDLT